MRKIVMVIVLVVGMFVSVGLVKAGEFSKSFIKAKAKYEKKVKEIEDKAQKEKTKEIEKVIKEYKKEIKKCSKAGKVDESNELNDEMKELVDKIVLSDEKLLSLLIKNKWTFGKERIVEYSTNGKVSKGRNEHEHSYKVKDGKLIFYNNKKEYHSVYIYSSKDKMWNQIHDEKAVYNADRTIRMKE